MIVVVGTRSNFRRWVNKRPSKAGQYLPYEDRYENAVNVTSEETLIAALGLDDINELIVLDKSVKVDLSIIHTKIAVNKLLSRD